MRRLVRAHGAAVLPAAALLLTVMTLLPAGLWGQAPPLRIKPGALVTKGIDFEALLTAGTPVETQVSGDGDAFVEPNETWSLTIPLTNTGNHDATGVVGTLTTSTPGVTILTGTSAYPDLTVGFAARPAAALPTKGELPPMPTGTNVTPFVFRVGSGVPCGEVLQFTLTVTYHGGNIPPGNSPQSFPFTIPTGAGKPAVCDAPPTGALITATKAVTGGNQLAGGTVIYTVTLNNTGPAAQADNAGNEFTDTVPSPLVVATPTASSGTVSAAGVNPVTWNGPIPAGGSVTITIPATIPTGTAGQTVSNQGTVNYDIDNDGTNGATTLTDAPGGAANDPTTFVVGGVPIGAIPTLSDFGLALLALMVAGAAVLALRRRQATGA
ncbi:MAG TPA: IPTL-CTERM sorting domain-containing protein [Thermoanaerobaculia bacterium]|nr:IPTL-CTERM sorting domain-containing protein [Thermoanaerobaculia bacterium]